MADTDPPDKIDDRESPAYRDVDAPNSHALGQQVAHGNVQHAKNARRQSDNQYPEHRRVLREHDAGKAIGDGAEGLAGTDDRWPYAFRRPNVDDLLDSVDRGPSLWLLQLGGRVSPAGSGG